jgi:hypothetical protein
MTQAQILNEFEQLSVEQQLEILAAAVRIIQRNVQHSDWPAPISNPKEQLAEAANALLIDYREDAELTSFTVLDGEDFYVQG